jgi:hypothetical protein
LSLDRIRGAIPANSRLTKSRQQPAEPTCAYRGERASPDDTRELARDSAVRRAHSTDVGRPRHACAHFLLCRTRHGKLEVGRGCGWRGSVNAAVDALDHRPGGRQRCREVCIRPVVSGRGLGAHGGTRLPIPHAGTAAPSTADERSSLRWCGWRGEQARGRCQSMLDRRVQRRRGSPDLAAALARVPD